MKKEDANYNNSIEYAVEYFSKAIQEAIRSFHKKMGFPISHEEYIILEMIHLTPGIIQIEIANKILMQRSYVGKLLNKLADLNYVDRVQEIKGKRQIIYRNYLTPSGQKLYSEMNNFIVKEIHKKPTDKQRKELDKISSKLILLADKMKKDFNLNF